MQGPVTEERVVEGPLVERTGNKITVVEETLKKRNWKLINLQ